MSDRLTMNEAPALPDAVATQGVGFCPTDCCACCLRGPRSRLSSACLTGTSRRFGQGAPGFRAVFEDNEPCGRSRASMRADR